MPHYLVTGGYGFIGSHLVDALLARGHRVRILDDLSTGHVENVQGPHEFVRGDVADTALVRQAMAGMDGCFHLAAVASVERSNQDWVGTHRINQGGSVNVFDAARTPHPRPVVYASSAAVYGDNPDLPLRETAPHRPMTAYGADKAASEYHAGVAALVHGVSTVGLRFFNVYGPRQDPRSPYSGVISIFAHRILNRLPITLFGDGGQDRDFVYVADVVTHLLAAMALCEGQHRQAVAAVYNVCTGRSITILELADALFRQTGWRTEVVHAAPRAGDIRRSAGNPQAAVAALGVAARTPLDEGLAALLESLRS
ncbi:MAG: NAD-dependent epimerase/dehydratase family protein [Magnetococcus sp. WYHC-3]